MREYYDTGRSPAWLTMVSHLLELFKAGIDLGHICLFEIGSRDIQPRVALNLQSSASASCVLCITVPSSGIHFKSFYLSTVK